MISVIIPVWNEKRESLLDAVQSLRSVWGGEVEIVIVDDGCENPIDPIDGCVLVRHATNRGIAAAMNTGLDASSGEYIAHLSATDVRYAAQREQFNWMLEHGYAATFARCINDATGEIRPLAKNWRGLMFRDGQFQWGTTIVHRSIREECRIDETLRYSEDWDWCMRVERKFGWHLFDEVVGTCTEWPGGWSDLDTNPERRAMRQASRKVVARRALNEYRRAA